MVKRVFIIHGWDFNPKMNWYPWLAGELMKRGFKVEIPKMPETSGPDILSWVSNLDKVVGKLDEKTYFIGHSIGCQAIMRYIQDKKQKIGGAVFVAGWFDLANLEGEEVEKIAQPWLEEPIRFNKVKQNIGSLTVILSDNDPYDCLEKNSSIFKDKLAAKVLVEHEKGHFTEDEGITRMPEVLKELLEMEK